MVVAYGDKRLHLNINTSYIDFVDERQKDRKGQSGENERKIRNLVHTCCTLADPNLLDGWNMIQYNLFSSYANKFYIN